MPPYMAFYVVEYLLDLFTNVPKIKHILQFILLFYFRLIQLPAAVLTDILLHARILDVNFQVFPFHLLITFFIINVCMKDFLEPLCLKCLALFDQNR